MKIPDIIALQNLEASRVTAEEIQVLFQGERRDTMYEARANVWTESMRVAKRQLAQ